MGCKVDYKTDTFGVTYTSNMFEATFCQQI